MAGTVLVTLLLLPIVGSIMTPEIWFEIYEKQRGNGDRAFISEFILENEDYAHSFLESTPCISSFIKKYTKHSDRVSLWISEDIPESFPLVNSFLASFEDDFAFFIIRDEISANGEQRTAVNSILLARNSTSFENVSSCLLHLCDRNCEFFVVMTDVFDNDEIFLEEADIMVQLMWNEYSIARVVVLGAVGNTVLLAGSTTFKTDEPCTPSMALLLDKCETNEWNAFEGIQPLELNGCIVNLGYFELHPFVGAQNESDKLTGIEGLLVEQVMTTLHVGLNRYEIPWNDTINVTDSLKQWLVGDAKVDIILGGMLWDPNDVIDYTVTYEAVKVVWLLPVTTNVSLRGLISPLQVYVWLAVGIVLILAVLIRSFVIRDVTLLDVSAIFVLVSTAKQPTRTSSRFYYIGLTLFSFLLAQFYLASLAEQLVGASNYELDTLEELVNSNFKLGGGEVFDDLLEVGENQGDSMMSRIREKFVAFNRQEYVQQMTDLISGKNQTFALMAMLNVSNANPVVPPTVHVLEEPMGTYPIALATWRGLPYLDLINTKIQDLIDVGLMQVWSSYFSHNTSTLISAADASTVDTDELHIRHFLPAFLLMAMGFIAGLLLFGLEILLYPSKWLE